MRFTCCLNMVFALQSLNWALICLHDVTPESVAALTDHFADVFISESVVHVFDEKFEADAIMFREIQCKKTDILTFKRRFQHGLC